MGWQVGKSSVFFLENFLVYFSFRMNKIRLAESEKVFNNVLA